MAKAPRRVYEIAPAWPFGTRVVMDVAGWDVPLTTSLGFEQLERWDDTQLPTEARLLSKPRKQVPELILTGARTPIVSAGVKSVLESDAAGECEFRSFTLQWEDGTAVPGEWHLCNLLKRIVGYLIACVDRGLGLCRSMRSTAASTSSDGLISFFFTSSASPRPS